MRYIVFLIVALLSGLANAAPGDYSIVLHGASYHTVPRKSGPAWNQANPGIGLRYELSDDISIQVGAYKNSYYRKSIYGGVDWTPLHVGRLQLGGFLGVATGYVEKAGVAGGGVVRWQGDAFHITARIVPAKCSIFAFEIGYRF